MSQAPAIDRIRWDLGSAYDLFISLMVVHNPSDFGVRPAWAAGMRQRLPTAEREFLEMTTSTIYHGPPLVWLAGLPPPKHSLDVILELEKMEPIERSFSLAGVDEPLKELFLQVAARGEWNQSQARTCEELYAQHWDKHLTNKAVAEKLDSWAGAREAGERIAAALRTYHEVFFAEEEHRILPFLERGLERARQIASGSNFPDLMLELSQGVRYDEGVFNKVHEIVLAPSFWSTPTLLIHPGKTTVITFGVRPANTSLIPGELVPYALLTGLTALSDPTRLRILRYLKSEQLTPTQLASRLRLRAPTVVHHLKLLRNAGLVTLLSTQAQKETLYEMRKPGLDAIANLINEFFSTRD